MNNYRIISDIGSGAYSTVHKAIDVNTGHIVAIKKISDENMNIRHIINRQVSILHECFDHPNIIKLYKCFTLNTFTYLVFQYMPMDLISYYKTIQSEKKRNLDQEEICYIIYQLANALKFLHSKGIMHRDIKPQNILIDPNTLKIKLIDFGFAKKFNPNTNSKENFQSAVDHTGYMVTRWYRPLQIVLSLSYTQKVDIFATGALLLQLYIGHQIFRSNSNVDQFYWILNICGFNRKWIQGLKAIQKLNLKIQQNNPQLKDLIKGIRPLGADIITKMLKSSPQQRITIQEVVNHPYFSRFKVRNNLYYNQLQDNSTINNDPNKITQLLQLPSRNRAFSTQNIVLTFRSKRNSTDDIPQSMGLLTVNSKQFNVKKQTEQSVKRIRTQANEQNKKYIPLLTNQPNKDKVLEPTKGLRNRVKSLNQGINVVSLKKLKIQRTIENQKSKQKNSKIVDESHVPQTIRLNPRKQKPMFLRVKDKINEGNLKDRGGRQAIQQNIYGQQYLFKKQSNDTKNKLTINKDKKYHQYKQYQFNPV